MMKILGINTATPITEIALVEDTSTVMEKHWQSNYDEAEKLLPEIINTLADHQQLDQIFVVGGPGSYTGLRIGVTAANVVAMLKKCEISTLNTFDFLRHRLPEDEKTAIILRAGGRNVALTTQSGEEPEQLSADEVKEYLKDKGIKNYFAEQEEVHEILKNAGLKGVSFQELLPFDSFLSKLKDLSLPAQKLIRPIYLNPPQITISNNALRRSNSDR